MLKKAVAISVWVMMVSGLAVAQDAKTVISNASKALGADNLRTIQYSGAGSDFTVGQNVNPNAAWPKFNLRGVTRTLDLNGMTIRHVAVRTQGENPPRGGGGQPLAGEQNQDNTATPASAWAAQLQFWLTPYGFLNIPCVVISKN